MDAFTDDPGKIGIPQYSADAFFQPVQGVEYYSTVPSLNLQEFKAT